MTLADVNLILQIPSIFAAMRRGYKIEAHKWSVPGLSAHSPDGSVIYIDKDLEYWRIKGKPVDCMRFLLLKEHVAMSILEAYRNGTSTDKKKLRLVLKMDRYLSDIKGPVINARARQIAKLVEEGPVRQAHGSSGLRSYRRFMAAQDARPRSGPPCPILPEA